MAYLGENSQNELDSVRMPSQGKRMNAPVNRQLKEKVEVIIKWDIHSKLLIIVTKFVNKKLMFVSIYESQFNCFAKRLAGCIHR